MLPDNHPFVVAHRGVHLRHRENTLPAFEEAIAAKADCIEFDVRRTEDGVLILNHDESIGPHLIAQTQAAKLIHHCAQEGFELPQFVNVLKTLHNRIRLDIELKEEGYEHLICEHLQSAAWQPSDYVLTSFNDASILRLKHLSPTSKCGLLFENETSIERLKACHADFAAPHFELLSPDFCHESATAGYPLWPWTVNEPEDIRSILANPGVEALITDRVFLVFEARTSLF